MTPLATLDQFTARMTTTPDTTRANAVLADVSAAVRAYTGQDFTRATTTDRLRFTNGLLRLPQRPVHQVTAVVDLDGNAVDVTYDGLDKLTTTAVVDAALDVTYDHGYDTVPDDIVAVVCNVAGRSLATPTEVAGIQQTTITNYSFSIGPVGATGSLGLFDQEKAVLDRYRRFGFVWQL